MLYKILSVFFILIGINLKAQSFDAKVWDNADLKEIPEWNSKVIINIPSNEKVKVLELKNGYAKVSYKEFEGYMNEVRLEYSEEVKIAIDSIKNEQKIVKEQLIKQKEIEAQKRYREEQDSSMNYIKDKLYNNGYDSSFYKQKKYVQPKSSYRTYYTGSRGGCYYINSNGKKTYVDRSYCK